MPQAFQTRPPQRNIIGSNLRKSNQVFISFAPSIYRKLSGK